MSRKVWIIMIAGIAIVLLNSLHVFGTTALGNLIDFALTVGIIYWAVMSIKRLNPSSNRVLRKVVLPEKVAEYPTADKGQPNASGLSQVWVLIFIFLIIMFCFAFRIMAAAGLNFFVWGDHLLGADQGRSPVFMWALAGLFPGAMIGSIVIWRKYRIKFQWCLVTIAPFLVMLFFLQVLSDPLQAIEPSPLAAAVDSARVKVPESIPVIPKRHRHKVLKEVAPVDTAKEAPPPVACSNQQANISVNARTDSVNVYYRTAGRQDGPWSSWKSKFIPQQGQFSLTDDGPVLANGIQYYYEIKSVMSRSAQNPYTRQLCDGPLVIDTY